MGRDGTNILMWNIPLATKGEREADDLPPKPHSPRNPSGPSTNLARCPLQHQWGHQPPRDSGQVSVEPCWKGALGV